MYVKINVSHIAVKYFLDPDQFDPAEEDAEFKRVFAATLAGARSIGYDISVLRRFHASKGREVLEVTLFWDVGYDFLMDPYKRLFLRNDLRTMTSSMMHSMRGHVAAHKVQSPSLA